jgi:hypothetical protein
MSASIPAPRGRRMAVQKAVLAVGIVFLAVLGTSAEVTAQRVGGEEDNDRELAR